MRRYARARGPFPQGPGSELHQILEARLGKPYLAYRHHQTKGAYFRCLTKNGNWPSLSDFISIEVFVCIGEVLLSDQQ